MASTSLLTTEHTRSPALRGFAIAVRTGQAVMLVEKLSSFMSVLPLLVSVGCFLLFSRGLIRTGTDTGAQPLFSEDGKLILAVNGEIYNHLALRQSLGSDVKFKTHSDCEPILALVSPL